MNLPFSEVREHSRRMMLEFSTRRAWPFRLLILAFGLVSIAAVPIQGYAEGFGDDQAVVEVDPLKVKASLEPKIWSASQIGTLVLSLSLPKEYHAYEDQFRLEWLQPQGFQHGQLKIIGGTEFFDKFTKKNRRGAIDGSVIEVTVEAPAKISDFVNTEAVLFELTYQACTEKNCLFPVTQKISAPIRWAGASLKNADSTGDQMVGADQGLKEVSLWSFKDFFSGRASLSAWLGQSLILTFFLVFLGGVLTSFTPCIFPMIPITMAILSGQEKRTAGRRFLYVLAYVVGIAVTYALLGFAAASSGQLFGSLSGNSWVLGSICVVTLVMALSMFGLFEIQTPLFLQNRFGRSGGPPTLIRAFLAGLVAGVIASPCVGPVLVTLLSFVASKANPILGVLLLFTFAMGLGTIFLVLGIFEGALKKMPRSGPWMVGAKSILGIALMAVFLFYLGILVPDRVWEGALGILLVAFASWFGAFAVIKEFSKRKALQKGLWQAVLILGFGFLLNAFFQFSQSGPIVRVAEEGELIAQTEGWQPLTNESLAAARMSGQPVIVDFSADWCTACHEMDLLTFANPTVKSALKNFVLLRFDATRPSPELDAFQKEYQIFGLPTYLFFSKDGKPLPFLTLTSFESAKEFSKRLQKVDFDKSL